MITMPAPVLNAQKLALAVKMRAVGFHNNEIARRLNISTPPLTKAFHRIQKDVKEYGIDRVLLHHIHNMEDDHGRPTIVALLMEKYCGQGRARIPDMRHMTQEKVEARRRER